MCGAVSRQLRLTARLECMESSSETSSRLKDMKSATCSPSGCARRSRCPASISKLMLPAGARMTGTPGLRTAVARFIPGGRPWVARLRPVISRLDQVHGAVVVAVIAMGMVQPSVYQVIDVVSVRDGFVSTAWPMLVRAARLRGALHGVGRAE